MDKVVSVEKMFLIFVLFLVIMSCGADKEKLVGLYELRELNVDGLNKYRTPVFIEFKDDQRGARAVEGVLEK